MTTTSQPMPQGSLIFTQVSSPSKASDSSALSTSFGAAGSVLSLSSSMPMSAGSHRIHSGLSMSTSTSASSTASSLQQENGSSHSHLGVLCNMPGSPPSAGSAILSQSFGSRPNGGIGAGIKRTSSTLNADDDDEGSLLDGVAGKNHKGETHKCETCSKVYRHPSCLVKHRWEHTIHWRESSKLSGSKHQTVQLLEAAAILVGMESPARSLPEEKALWPAAVSPPSSGLLGSDKVNFVKLMSSKVKSEQFSQMNQQQSATQHNGSISNSININRSSSQDPASPLSTASDLSRSATHPSSFSGASSYGSATPTIHAGTLSPLNGLGDLALSSPPTRAQNPRNSVSGMPKLSLGGSGKPTTHHPNMVGYIRTGAHAAHHGNGRATAAAVITASTTAGRASKKAAKAIDVIDEADGDELDEADADADVKVLHLDWDSSSHSDRTESDDLLRGSATSAGSGSGSGSRTSGGSSSSRRSGRSGSVETDGTSSAGGGLGVTTGPAFGDEDAGALGHRTTRSGAKTRRMQQQQQRRPSAGNGRVGRTRGGSNPRAGHDDDDDDGDDGDDDDDNDDDEDDEEEEDSSRSFGDADGMDAMEMETLE